MYSKSVVLNLFDLIIREMNEECEESRLRGLKGLLQINAFDRGCGRMIKVVRKYRDFIEKEW